MPYNPFAKDTAGGATPPPTQGAEPQQPQTPQPKPAAAQPAAPYNPFAGGAKPPKNTALPGGVPTGGTQTDQANIDLPTMPFMAKEVDANGNAYYGEGFQGWARKTFASIYDPQLFDYHGDKNVENQFDSSVQAATEQLNQSGWQNWGEKILGISSQELATGLTASLAETMKAADQGATPLQQDIMSATRGLKAGVKFDWAAFTGVVGLTDFAARKVYSFREGIHDAANSAYTENPEPLTGFKKGIDSAVLMNPMGALYDIAKLGTALVTGKTNIKDVQSKIGADMAGSAMLGTMITNDAKKNEFLSRLAKGENAELLTQELQNPWAELAVSLAGDPLTWEGAPVLGKGETILKLPTLAGDVKIFGKTLSLSLMPEQLAGKVIGKLPWEVVDHLPTFGDVLGKLGINVGKAAQVSEASRFTEPAKEVQTFIDSLGKASNSVDEVAAKESLIKSASEATQAILDRTKSYGAFSFNSEGKAAQLGRDSHTVLMNMIVGSRDTEDTYKIAKNYGVLFGSTATKAEKDAAAIELMSHSLAPILTSEKGLQTGHFLGKLMEGNVLSDLVKGAEGDKTKLAENLFKHYETVLHDTFPSVDDMWKAANEVKTGAQVNEKTAQLAQKYNDIKKTGTPAEKLALAVRDVTRKIDIIHQPIVGAMGNIYIRWNPAFFAKNLEGQGVIILAEMGPKAALEITGRAAQAAFGQSERILGENEAKMTDMLGFVHEAAIRGFGSAVGKSAAADAEKITSSEIVIRTVTDEIQKALKSGAIPLNEMDALEKEAGGAKQILFSSLKKHNGNVDKAIGDLREAFNVGHLNVQEYVKMPDKLQKYLGENHLLDEFQTLQKNSSTMSLDEYTQAVDDFVNRHRDTVTNALSKQSASLGEKLMKDEQFAQVGDAALEAQSLYHKGEVSYETANEFTAMTQAGYNMSNQLDNLAIDAQTRLGRLLTPDLATGMATELKATTSTTREMFNTITDARNKVRYAIQEARNGGDLAQIMKGAATSDFNLAETLSHLNPETTSAKQFTNEAWQAYYDWAAQTYHDANAKNFNDKLGIYDKYAQQAGTDIETLLGKTDGQDESLFEQVNNSMHEFGARVDEYNVARAEKQVEALQTTERAKVLGQNTKALKSLANQYGVDSNAIVNTVNKYSEPVTATIANDVTKSPTKLIQEHGGVNIQEFSDVISGKSGVDKQGVLPGLFQKQGMGIDEAGRLLVEHGYITADQAKDANFIRDFIRNPEASSATFTQPVKYTDISQISPEAAKAAFEKRLKEKGLPPIKKLPPPYTGENPTHAMALYKNLDGFEKDIRSVADSTAQVWGKTVPLNQFSKEAEGALNGFKDAYNARMAVVRTNASALATAKRDFLLHSYDKTYLDHALGYLMPFHYWTDRTYMNWMEKVIENPGLAADYAKYRDFKEKANAGLPSWWKYNTQIPNIFGSDSTHPLFMNLEASLNPMNNLIGEDFNDPYKRADWLSKSVDDLNSFGPTFSPIIQWAVGAHLYNQGNEEAGQRWFSRLLPQSTLVKAGLQESQNLLSKIQGKPVGMLNFGPAIKNNEVDPFVNLLEGGLDPYERNRVGRALSYIEQQKIDQINNDPNIQDKNAAIGTVKAQMIEDARNQQGDNWDQAIQMATTWRAPGQLMAGVLGIGFKARTEADVQIDQFYSDYNTVRATASNISPEDYKAHMDQLQEKYPFMDTLLLAKKGGAERDSAYIYNVMGRLPPGSQSDLLKQFGIDPKDVSSFYDVKGDLSQLTPGEKGRLIAASVDIASMLQVPDTATRQEWTSARNAYGELVTKGIQNSLGSDIWDKVSHYYDLKDTNVDEANAFRDQHPEVSQALQIKGGIVANSPILSAYYGGIDNIEAYISGNVRQQLEDKFGKDIYATQTAYYDAPNQKVFLRQHPELKAFMDYKKVLDKKGDQMFYDMASKLPQGKPAQFQTGFTPQSSAQQNIANALQPQAPIPQWQDISQSMPSWLQTEIANHAQTGKAVSYRGNNELDFLAKQSGYYSGADLLRVAALSLKQYSQGSSQAVQTQGSNPYTQQSQSAYNPFAQTSP